MLASINLTLTDRIRVSEFATTNVKQAAAPLLLDRLKCKKIYSSFITYFNCNIFDSPEMIGQSPWLFMKIFSWILNQFYDSLKPHPFYQCVSPSLSISKEVRVLGQS